MCAVSSSFSGFLFFVFGFLNEGEFLELDVNDAAGSNATLPEHLPQIFQRKPKTENRKLK